MPGGVAGDRPAILAAPMPILASESSFLSDHGVDTKLPFNQLDFFRAPLFLFFAEPESQMGKIKNGSDTIIVFPRSAILLDICSFQTQISGRIIVSDAFE